MYVARDKAQWLFLFIQTASIKFLCGSHFMAFRNGAIALAHIQMLADLIRIVFMMAANCTRLLWQMATLPRTNLRHDSARHHFSRLSQHCVARLRDSRCSLVSKLKDIRMSGLIFPL